MAIELELERSRQIVDRLNDGVQAEDIDNAFSRNRDLRIILKTGDLIYAAAGVKGVELKLEDQPQTDEWINLIPEMLVSNLRDHHGDSCAKSVLKEARRVASQGSLNGDKEGVLGTIRTLISSLGRPQKSSALPEIPAKATRH